MKRQIARAVLGSVPPGGRRTQADVVRAVKQVAARLGNTPAVCRKCYVHPVVISSYLDGKLEAALTRAAAHRPTKGQEWVVPHGKLRADEAAVLALLRAADRGLGAASR